VTPDRDHPWDLTPAEAIHLQQNIREQIELRWDNHPVHRIGGADVSYVRRWNKAFAVIKIFECHQNGADEISLEEIESKSAELEIQYPYIPGLLTFREGPALEAVWNQLEHTPDLLIFDGAGIAHPRQCGLAAHLGWRWDVPAFGCAKSRLFGQAAEVGKHKGNVSPLMHKKTQIGYVVRTRTRVKPLWVSPGHRTTLNISREWTLKTVTQYKLPEPTRLADHATKMMVQQIKQAKS